MYNKSDIKLNPIFGDDVNEIIDEGSGNSFIALRKVKWDENKDFKLDIRKWYTNSNGEEIAGKGVGFITEDGPTNLIKALIKHGYGNTRQILEQLSEREEFPIAVKEIIVGKNIDIDGIVLSTNDNVSITYYDPNDIL